MRSGGGGEHPLIAVPSIGCWFCTKYPEIIGYDQCKDIREGSLGPDYPAMRHAGQPYSIRAYRNQSPSLRCALLAISALCFFAAILERPIRFHQRVFTTEHDCTIVRLSEMDLVRAGRPVADHL